MDPFWLLTENLVFVLVICCSVNPNDEKSEHKKLMSWNQTCCLMQGQATKVLNLPKTIFQSRPFATAVNNFFPFFSLFAVSIARLPLPLFLYH